MLEYSGVTGLIEEPTQSFQGILNGPTYQILLFYSTGLKHITWSTIELLYAHAYLVLRDYAAGISSARTDVSFNSADLDID